MGQFMEAEKKRQALLKQTTNLFSSREDGTYRNAPRPFCIPQKFAEENLFKDIREGAMNYFSRHNISWHGGQNNKPSNHLCSSQVSCVNFLFPFVNHPAALIALLHPIMPNIKDILPLDEQCVAFEWIGLENYLGEGIGHHRKRSRGQHFTSADAAIRVEGHDGIHNIFLIEWKYAESYGNKSYAKSDHGTDRIAIYRHIYEQEDFPLDKSQLPSFDALFYEPFYQLFRQQALAYKMEKARELDADRVYLLHIAPGKNNEFQRVTSPALKALGSSVSEIWQQLAKDRFHSVTTEQLFSQFPIHEFPELQDWWQYLLQRYPHLTMRSQ